MFSVSSPQTCAAIVIVQMSAPYEELPTYGLAVQTTRTAYTPASTGDSVVQMPPTMYSTL